IGSHDMNVANLQQHLANLAKLFDASGGKSVAKDLDALATALTPFAAQSPAEFTRFLALAHEYHTTGKLSPPPKAPRKAAANPARAAPGEVAATIRSLYDRAGDLSLTMEQIDTELAKMNGLTKDGLLKVCEAMELAGMKSKKVPDIRAAIGQKIK